MHSVPLGWDDATIDAGINIRATNSSMFRKFAKLNRSIQEANSIDHSIMSYISNSKNTNTTGYFKATNSISNVPAGLSRSLKKKHWLMPKTAYHNESEAKLRRNTKHIGIEEIKDALMIP